MEDRDPQVIKRKNSVIRSALGMAVGTFSSRILGFIRDALMFALFPRAVTDAFVVAFRLPNLFRRLLGEGSISVGFVPLFIETRGRSTAEAERLAAQVFTVIIALAVVISVTGFVYMDQVIWALVGNKEGFASDPGQIERTVYLARIMIFYLVLVSTYAFHTAVANALGEFFWPAVGPTLFNLGLIIFTLLPWEMGPYAGAAQAWGVIFGGFLQAGVVLWLLLRIGHPPRLVWKWDSGVAQVFREMLPGMFSLGVFQIVGVLNTKFAAPLSQGAQSYLYLADRVLELPQSLIAVSLGAALLPRFSELQTSSSRGAFLREAEDAVRVLFFLSLPAAVGMFVLSEPITSVLFGRGAFVAADTVGTARVVEVYALLLLVSGVSRLLTPAFYAAKYVWLPAILSLITLGFHMLLAPWMVDFYGLRGLAIATTATLTLNLILLGVFFHGKIGAMDYTRIGWSLLRVLPACLVLGAFCYFAYPALATALGLRSLALALTISFGVLIYFGAAKLCGAEEASRVFAILRRRRA